MQNSPTAAYLRELPFHERLLLAALLRVVKREGVEEVRWGDVRHQHTLHVPVLADDAARLTKHSRSSRVTSDFARKSVTLPQSCHGEINQAAS